MLHAALFAPLYSLISFIIKRSCCLDDPASYTYLMTQLSRKSNFFLYIQVANAESTHSQLLFFKPLKVTESPACLGELFILKGVVSIVYLHIISLFRSRDLLTNQPVACSDSGPNCWIVYTRGRLSWWVFSAQTLVRSKRVLT